MTLRFMTKKNKAGERHYLMLDTDKKRYSISDDGMDGYEIKCAEMKMLMEEANRNGYRPFIDLSNSSTRDIFEKVSAAYTGGGIWLFYGLLHSGEYFLTDDYGDTLLLDESPEDFDVSLYGDWQKAHTIKELMDSERTAFCDKLADRLLRHNEADDDGGITDQEVEHYKRYWRMAYYCFGFMPKEGR